jgi:hypothetical protein
MNPLQNFYENTPVREAVHAYLIETLREEIIVRAFQGQDVKDVAEAKKIIDKSFAKLNGNFAKKKEIQQQNI